MPEFSLKYLIEVSSDKAKAALRSLEQQFDKLNTSAKTAGGDGAATDLTGTSSALALIGSLAGPAEIGIGAIATALTAAAGAASLAAAAIVSFTREAAAFGSEISDLRDKTGLAAETLIAMRLAAEQSGTSLEAVTKGIAKFAKLVGEADRGSKEAQNTLKRFGLTASQAMKDLDGALEKVFKSLLNARSGVEQMALAQQAFGRSGTDLLPFIKTFNGDLKGLVEQAKELGLTFDNETAAAADRLDDRLKVLELQFSAIKTQIGLAFIPVLTDLANILGDFLKSNQNEIRRFSSVTADAATGAIAVIKETVNLFQNLSAATTEFTSGPDGKVISFFKELYFVLDPVSNLLRQGVNLHVDAFNRLADTGQKIRNSQPVQAQVGGIIDLSGELTEIDNAAREQSKALEQRMARIADVVAVGKERIARMLAEGTISRETALNAELYLERNALETRKSLLQQQLKIVKDNADEVNAVRARLASLESERMKFEESARRRLAENEKSVALDATKKRLEYIEFEIRERQAMTETAIARNREQLALGLLDEKTEFQARIGLEEDFLAFKRQKLDEQLAAVRGNAEEEMRIRRAIALADLDIERKKLEDAVKAAEFAQSKIKAAEEAARRTRLAEIDAEQRQEELRIQQRIAQNQLLLELGVISALSEFEARQNLEAQLLELRRTALEQQLAAVRGNAEEEARIKLALAELSIQIDTAEIERLREKSRFMREYQESLKEVSKTAQMVMSSLGIEIFKTNAEVMEETLQGLADMSREAFNSMAQGVGQMVQAWVLYGEVGPDALRKMLAATLAALAQEAAVKALFQLAEGFASLFFNPAEAEAHFKAAAIYAAVAATAAVVGRAVAGDSFKKSGSAAGAGGGRAGTSGSSRTGSTTGQATPAPISRESENAFMSGRDGQVAALARAVDKLAAKIDSQSPGNILVAGARQRPGVISETVEREVRSNSAFGTRLLRQAGAR